ncbi:MAG: zinc-ribbon domain-containing protein [Burkholderiaceae bacterium]|nr:zinc-ribbon domain-containing protein [Burkholderiaceae bacterium]
MALATTCPQCKTSFKVVPDQLKLRRGLVRCGMCQHVFSGVDYLRYVDESKRATARDAAPRTPAGPEGALETAFFLPETILAAPPAGSMPGSPQGRDPSDADAGADAPVVGTTDSDLLALGREPVPPDVQAGRAPGPVGPPSIDWPGAQIDWQQDPTLPLTHRPLDDTPADESGNGEEADTTASPPTHAPPEPGEQAAPQTATAPEAASEQAPAEQAAVPEREQAPVRDPEHEPAPGPEPWPGPGEPWPTALPRDDGIGHEPVFAPEPVAGREPMEEPASDATTLDQVRAPHDEGHGEVESLTATAPVGFDHTGHDDERDEEDRGGDARRPAFAAPAFPAMSHLPAAGSRLARSPGREHDVPEHDDEAVIDYFSSGRRGIGFVDRHGPLALLGVALLVVLLGLQWAIAQRSMIAARLPALAPVMSTLLAPFGLSVGPPRDLESLTIESFELQASATPGVLAMSALLRNRADYAVQWPSMQLTLTDTANRVLVRKVLLPADYLREAGGDGIPARAEWPVRMALEAKDLHPAGYSVVLFYP